MNRLAAILVLGWISALLSSAAADTFAIASDGKAAAPIVIGHDACAATRHMAEALQTVLGRIAGTPFAIERGDGRTGLAVGVASEFPELVGDLELKLKERFAPTDLATRQGYVLRSHAAGMQIVGASEIGVIYGGWELLHRLGYRQFFPHEAWEIVPRRPDLSVAVDVFERPDYVARNLSGSVTQEWNERNRASIGYSWKIPMKPYIPERWQKPLIQNHHNWGAIVEHSREEFEAHPEYLGLVRVRIDPKIAAAGEAPGTAKAVGEAQPRGEEQVRLAEPDDAGAGKDATELRRVSSKLCVAKPRVRELAVRYALDYFRNNPEVPSISMEPTDGSGWCECADCAAVGSPSERVMLLANTVAEALEADYPDKYVGILSYHLHADPPVRRAHPRVCVSLATGLSGPKSMDERLDGWARVCGNLGIYEYLSVAEWHLGMPAKSRAAHLAYLTEKIPAWHARNVRFFTGQAAGGAWGGHGLGYYVLSRLLWDVDEARNVQAIVDDFLEKAFGTAAEPMREYYRVIDGSQAKAGTGAFFRDRAARMYAALRAAKQATADPAVHRRLNQLVLYARYVELFGEEVEARRTDGHYPALVRLVRFACRIRNEGMVDGCEMARAYINGAAAVPLRPDPAAASSEVVLEEQAPVVHEVDRPFTEAEIEAILNGTSTVSAPDSLLPTLPDLDRAGGAAPNAELPEP